MLRWRIAEEMGWSLEYIDALSLGDVWEYLSLQDARAKLRADAATKTR